MRTSPQQSIRIQIIQIQNEGTRSTYSYDYYL